MNTNIDKFIAKYKNLEVVDMPVPENLKKATFHKRIKNNNNPKYFIDYWHTGKFRNINGEYQHSGFEDKYLRAEITKLATFGATTEPVEEQNTHGQIVTFGKHKGERWTRIPVSYLRWLTNESETWRGMALSELKRRGTTLDSKIELSGHALDRASLNCRRIWHQTSEEGEGIHAWLTRTAMEALEARGDKELIRWKGLKLIFTFGEYYPVLKTVMPYKEDTGGKATISITNLRLWLKSRLNDLKEKKQSTGMPERKRMYGARATSYKEIIGYIESHLGSEKDVILEEKV